MGIRSMETTDAIGDFHAERVAGRWPCIVTGASPILLATTHEVRTSNGSGYWLPYPAVFCKCCIQKTYIFCKLFRTIVLGTIVQVLILNDLKLH
jgi:hypothetical protein